MPAIALVAWLTVVLTVWRPWAAGLLLVLVVAGLWLSPLRHRVGSWTLLGWLSIGLVAMSSTMIHQRTARGGALAELSQQRAQVSGVINTRSTPREHQGKYGDYVTLRARTQWILGRGAKHHTRAPVLIIAPRSWKSVELGSTLSFTGRMQTAMGSDLAGVIRVRGDPQLLRPPGWIHGSATGMRAAIRKSVGTNSGTAGALVPALVDGDDAGLDSQTIADFQVSGLTHLTAVSGANLTLACGALLLLARWIGIRRHGLVVVALLGMLGFVLLARAEPSVVRAAAMGTAALLGLGSNGRNAGMRAWGIAVAVLVLFDPWLGISLGFALSAVATASILWLAPGWRDALQRWMPRWGAEAIAVPLAAQIGCTPLVASISGQVSLVAVAANLLAAPAVAPATVLGLLAGVVTLVSETLGGWVARPAVWCCQWLLLVARKSAELPVATIEWSSQPLALLTLTLLCALSVLVLANLLRSPILSLISAAVLVLVLLVPIPTPGWPPRGWVLVACDVGQGDGLVLNTGAGSGIVIDTGPEPEYMDECLTRLGITRVPLLLLTHFHQDHAGGAAGVLAGRQVSLIEVTNLAEPLTEVRRVHAIAAAAGVEIREVSHGESGSLGSLRWQVLGPPDPPLENSDSPPNDASIVMLVETAGLRILLTGDAEEPAQRRLERALQGQRVDVLKVAHHGSAKQDPELIRGLDPRLALISVGTNNDYGHPAPSALLLLKQTDAMIRRTDQEGDLAVVASPNGALGVIGRGHPRPGMSRARERVRP